MAQGINPIAQIREEINTLAESYKDLEDAKKKFKDSRDAIIKQKDLPKDKEILVPLTDSMYVPGLIANSNQFLLDIGTQYLIEKDADGAVDYFDRKVKFIDVQLSKFSQLLQTRLEAREKLMASARAAQSAAAATTTVPAGSTASSSKQKKKS